MQETLGRRELLRRGALATLALAGAPRRLSGQRETASSSVRKETTRKMRLGLVTYNVARDWDFDTLLKICREAGLEAVEFRTTHAHGVEPTLDAARRREIRQRCADAGLRQISLGSICEFHSPDPAVVAQNVETCKAFVLLAKEIGARGVKVRPNGLPKEVPVEKTLEQIGRALRQCGEFGAEHGVEIWTEVHGAGTQLPANMKRLMDICGHKNVGITWNSNPTDLINGSVKEGFDLLRPHLLCCHINDLWGDYPYRELFGLLNQSDYDRFTLIECGFPIRAEDGVPFLKCYKGLWRELSR